jgi:hypothetical protein
MNRVTAPLKARMQVTNVADPHATLKVLRQPRPRDAKHPSVAVVVETTLKQIVQPIFEPRQP